MSDIDQLRMDERAARLRWDEAAARARAVKTPDEWRAELPEVQSFPFATAEEVEAEIKRVERIRPADLAAALRGWFDCPDFLRLDDELRVLHEQSDGLTGQDTIVIQLPAVLVSRRQTLLYERLRAAGRAKDSYLNYLRHRGPSPERVDQHIKERVWAQTAAECDAWQTARDRLAAGERKRQEQAVQEERAKRERKERAARDARAPWLRAMELQTEFLPPALDDCDLELVRRWTESIDGSYPGRAGWLSARFAERVALKVYQDLYGGVEDLSILQISRPSDTRWRYADLMVCGGKSIDVKNARRAFQSRNAYSDHCVPTFKRDRSGEDVRISAFLSPYIVCADSPSFTIEARQKHVVWLGETSRSEFERLKHEFGFLHSGSPLPLPSRLPPWLFDYPDECYIPRNEALTTLRKPEFPWSEARFPIGAYILGGQKPPESTREVIRESTELAGRIARMGLSRPVLFLHVLDRFCWAMRESETFPSLAFKDILWPSGASLDGRTLRVPLEGRSPLAVADPLETVRELINVLADVAEACGERAVSFDEFRLAGKGVFQGCQRGGRWVSTR